jgi:hypothetical protein
MAQKDSVALVVKPVSKMIVKGERYMTHAIPGVSIAWVIYLSPFTIILLTGLTTRATESF